MTQAVTHNKADAYVRAFTGGLLGAVLFLAIFLVAGQGAVGFVLNELGIFLSAMPLIWAGVTGGFLPVSLASLIGSATVFFVMQSAGATLVGGPLLFVSLYFVMDVLPALLVVSLSLLARVPGQPRFAFKGGSDSAGREWYPVGSILSWLVLLGAVFLLIAGYGVPALTGTGHGFSGLIAAFIDMLFRQFTMATPAASDPAFAESLVVAQETMKAYLPSILAFCWLLRVMIAGMVAQWYATKRNVALRETPDYGHLMLPEWSYLTLFAAVALALFAGGEVGYLAKNIAPVLALPWMLDGLNVVHRFCRKLPLSRLWLIVFYIVFLVGSVEPVLAGGLFLFLIILGFYAQWPIMRKKITASGLED